MNVDFMLNYLCSCDFLECGLKDGKAVRFLEQQGKEKEKSR